MFRDARMENNHLAVVRRSLWLPNLQMMYGLASFSQDYPVKQKEVLTCLLDKKNIYFFILNCLCHLRQLFLFPALDLPSA